MPMTTDTTITPAALVELFSRECTLVDVREPEEWAEEHSAEALLIPLGELRRRLHEIPGSLPVILVCGTGKRSEQGRRFLAEAGRRDVWSLQGGMNAWKAAGLPTLRPLSPRLSLQQQWQIVAGVGILPGVTLSLLLDPLWVLVAGIFGAGLLFAGISGHRGCHGIARRVGSKISRGLARSGYAQLHA